MNEYLKKYINLIKNNLTIITLFPTLIGAIWQIVQLATISVNMIRFFSISQFICDGLIILGFLFFAFVLICPLLFNIILQKEHSYKLKEKKAFYILLLFLLLLGVLFSFSHFNLIQYITIDRSISLIITYVAASAFIFCLNSFGIKWIRNYVIFNITYFFLYVILSIVITIISVNNISKNLSEINNFTVLIDKLEREDCYSKKPNVLYFNDKYIFIELEKKNKKSILIKKIDDLFDE